MPEDIPPERTPEPQALGPETEAFLRFASRLAPGPRDGIDSVSLSYAGRTVTLTAETGKKARHMLAESRRARGHP